MSTGSVSKNNAKNGAVYNVHRCKIRRCQIYESNSTKYSEIYGIVLLQSSYILCEVVQC